MDLNCEDISVSHRLSDGTHTRSDGVHVKRVPAIMVKFTKRSDRDNFYQARKRLKGKSTRDIGFTRRPNQPIYISESLTKKNKELFNICVKAEKAFGFKFIWTIYGEICLAMFKSLILIYQAIILFLSLLFQMLLVWVFV